MTGARTTHVTRRLSGSQRIWWPWVVAGALLVGAVAVIALGFYPGAMNGDSFVVIELARLGVYSTWYSPILVWIWHPFFQLGMGPAWTLLVQLVLFVAGTFALLRRAFRPIAASLVVCVIALSPQLFGQLALIGRNTWFLTLMVPCCACVNEAAWSRGRVRAAWTFATVAFAWLAVDSRPNAVAAVFVPLSLLAGLWLERRVARRWKLIVASLAIGIIGVLAMYETNSLAGHAVGAVDYRSIEQLYDYDLASMSRDDGRNYFPRSVYPGGTVQAIDRLTSTASALNLISGAGHPIAFPLPPAADAALEHRWKHEILAHPGTYIRERLDLMTWELGLGHDELGVYLPGVPPNPYGYSTRFVHANRIADDYENAFLGPLQTGGTLFAPWIYLLVCLAAVIAVALRPTRERLIIGVLGLAALTYQVGLLFGLMSTNYRYEAPCLALAGIIIALGLRDLWQVARGRMST